MGCLPCPDRVLPNLKEFGQILLTFVLVTIGWVIFRADNLPQAWEYFSRICAWNSIGDISFFISPVFLTRAFWIAVMLLVEWIDRREEHGLSMRGIRCRSVRYAIYFAILLITLLYFDDGSPKFEYKMVTENETVNSMVPIWQRSKSEVSDDDCIAWYKEKNRDRKDPCALVRVNAEGAVSYKAMLFVPGEQNENVFTGDNKGGITLYSNGVMIMEKCDKLVHEYFDFVKGVVDSPDLSLNISRELLQHDRQLRIIGQNLEKRIKGELEKLLREDRPKYEEFFKNFGVSLKAGVCDEYGRYKDFLKDLLIFWTAEDRQITLKEYVENMPESQTRIYYATADSLKRAISLPQCEEVRKRGYELLYLTNPLDEVVLTDYLREQDGKTFCNVVTDDLGFETDEEKKAAEERDVENKELLDFVKASVGDRIAKVKLSDRLSDRPCALTTEGGISLEMERYFRYGPAENMKDVRATRVLELNPAHHAFEVLKTAFSAGETEKAAKLSKILSTLAAMAVGDEVEDPTEFADLVVDFERGF